MIRNPRPSPSVFSYCKLKTGGGEGLGTRLPVISAYFNFSY